MYENALISSSNQPHQKKLKDHEEFLVKKKLIAESQTLNQTLTKSKEKLNELNDRINTHFKKANIKETELKNYIVDMNERLYDVRPGLINEMDDRIEYLHDEIIEMIGNIQDKVRTQIENTKKEMEKEVTIKFEEAEIKQKKLMNQKIEQQKKVFDRMNYTKGELEKIIKKFGETNSQCEMLLKRNTNLKVELEMTKKGNNELEKQLENLKKEHNRVEKDYNNILNENYNNNSTNKILDLSKNKNKSNKNLTTYNNNNNNNLNLNDEEFNENLYKQTEENKLIISQLKQNIEKSKKKYNEVYKEYIDSQKKKTEAQQLIQKCIEDIQIQINSAKNKMNQQNKLNQDNLNSYKKDNVDYKEMIKLLERKLKILTFVYDNGIQNLKSKKTGLFYK